MSSEFEARLRTILILLLVLMPGLFAVQTVYARNLPFLSISLSATTITCCLPGDSITVTGLLGGFLAPVTGTVTYRLFSGAACTGPLLFSSAGHTVGAGGIVTPATFFFTAAGFGAGTFSFQGFFVGDVNNFPATSPCVTPVTVNGTPTFIATAFAPLSNVAGGAFFDAVTTFTHLALGIATGTVTYKLFAGASCSDTPLQSQTKSLAGGVPPPSNPFTINNVGKYSFRAVYSGDTKVPRKYAGSTSACESPVTVIKKTPTLSTNPSSLSVTVRSTVNDAAILTGATSTAGGTVTYNLFKNGICGGVPIDTSTVTVTNGVVPGSKNFPVNTVGSFSLTAVYSGDANNNGATSGCEGPIVVSKASPSLFTTLSSFSIPVGGSVTDTATLVGATSNAGGTVTYKLFNDGSCGGGGGTVVQQITVLVNSGSIPSVSFTISVGGSYSIQAVYSGDANNNFRTSGCEGAITVS